MNAKFSGRTTSFAPRDAAAAQSSAQTARFSATRLWLESWTAATSSCRSDGEFVSRWGYDGAAMPETIPKTALSAIASA